MTVRILQGDCRSVLASLPDASVHCVVSSPPYYGLREYGTATWEGGDPACDHVIGAIRTGLGMAALGEQYRGGGKKAAEPKPLFAKAECPKCGALRFDQQIGLEDTPAEYVAALVAVFREVWRVLRDDGIAWLNLGDSYATGAGRVGEHPGGGAQGERWMSAPPGRGHRGRQEAHQAGKQAARVAAMGPVIQPNRMPLPGLKPKDLIMIPARVALALQDDGWWLRSDVIWHKPNPMPESTEDRPTSSHEHVFLLAKSGSAKFWTHRERAGTRVQPAPDYRWVHRETGEEIAVDPGDDKRWRRVNLWRGSDYFFDAEAVREQGESGPSDLRKMAEALPRIGGKHKTLDDALSKASAATNIGQKRSVGTPGTRNIRNVWTITTTPFPEAHFATFPAELAERCIKAGTSERGCCPSCAAPWVRIITKGESDTEHQRACGADVSGGYNGQSIKNHAAAGVQDASAVKARILAGLRERSYAWQPSCSCDAGDPVPCTVLDPFAGAFTAPLVADRLQRHAIGIELNRAYCEMAKRRIERDAGLFADLAAD